MNAYALTRLLLLVLAAMGSAAPATDQLISVLHAQPPDPCTAKSRDDMSSGIRIYPDGESDEQLRGVMGGLATVFLKKGAELVAPQNTTAVYTAVFYGGAPINEVGIYGYEFTIPIDATLFEAHEELNVKLHVIDGKLLLVLWSEKAEAAMACFRALDALIGERF